MYSLRHIKAPFRENRFVFPKPFPGRGATCANTGLRSRTSGVFTALGRFSVSMATFLVPNRGCYVCGVDISAQHRTHFGPDEHVNSQVLDRCYEPGLLLPSHYWLVTTDVTEFAMTPSSGCYMLKK